SWRRAPGSPTTTATDRAEGISSDALDRFRARLGLRAEELHQLVWRGPWLLAEFGGKLRHQLEVVLRVPVGRRRFDGTAELFFGPRQPAEPRIGLLLAARLFEERAAGPEMRQRALGRALGLVDRLVKPLQAVEGPQLVRHHVAVLAGEECLGGGEPVEP